MDFVLLTQRAVTKMTVTVCTQVVNSEEWADEQLVLRLTYQFCMGLRVFASGLQTGSSK